MEVTYSTRQVSAPPSIPEDIDSPNYTTAQMCAAADVPRHVVWKWTTGDSPTITFSDADNPGEGSGSPHYWTFRKLVQVALVVRMAKSFNIRPRRASLIAAGFSDIGSYGDPGDPDSAGELRLPGQLFTSGLTFLVGTAGEYGRCINVKLDALGTSLTRVFMAPGVHGDTAVILNVNQVVRDVMHRMAAAW